MSVGWVKIEAKLGKPRWHYFSDKNEMTNRHKSLCGQIRLYSLYDIESRHITEAGNCRSCAKILKKKEARAEVVSDVRALLGLPNEN